MRTLVTLAALALALSACSHPVDTAGADSFGDAVRMMHAAQTAPEAEAPEGSGAQGALAQQRYKAGQTHPLMPSSTSLANPGQ